MTRQMVTDMVWMIVENARLMAELNDEQVAHNRIAELCHKAGVSTPDGTSVGAVERLTARLAEVEGVVGALRDEHRELLDLYHFTENEESAYRRRAHLLEDRVKWCLSHSAMLFRKQVPEPMAMLAYFPLKQDGFLAAEVEGREVPVYTKEYQLADFGDDEDKMLDAMFTALSLEAPRE